MGFVLYLEFHPRIVILMTGQLIVSAFVCAALITGTVLRVSYLDDPAQKRKAVTITVWILFVFYAVYLVYLLFLDDAYGRSFLSPFSHRDHAGYFENSINFIPFKEISRYLTDVLNGELRYSAINIFGNMAAFAPMGFFLPVLFKRLRKFWPFVIFIICLITAVELLQLVLMTGSCDVDDLILNTLGAAVMFWIFRLKGFQKLFGKLGFITEMQCN